MITCHQIERSNPDHAKASELNQIVDTVTLDETDRHRRRLMLTSDTGIEFLLELESVTLLKHNDILRLSDGRGIRVQARPEALYEIRGDNANHLLKLTWHVGNRHLAAEIMHDHLRIRRDPVIKVMLEQLGATVMDIQDGFNPEGGAYGNAHSSHTHHAHTHG
ncbi:MAG: urease accessory protein UreE [Granulosicoccus sp.]